MPRKVLVMRQVIEILRLKHEHHLSIREIARSCGLASSTVGDYLRRAEAAGWQWPLPEGVGEVELEAGLSALSPLRTAGTPPPPVPDWAHLHAELRRPNVTLRLLWQEYIRIDPSGLKYSRFCERYQEWRKTLEPPLRQVHVPGETQARRASTGFNRKEPILAGNADSIVHRKPSRSRSLNPLYLSAAGPSGSLALHPPLLAPVSNPVGPIPLPAMPFGSERFPAELEQADGICGGLRSPLPFGTERFPALQKVGVRWSFVSSLHCLSAEGAFLTIRPARTVRASRQFSSAFRLRGFP